MKRFHLHLHVSDLDASIAFYSRMFGRQPDVIKHDYAKWLEDSPPLNFAVTRSGGDHGVGHVGLQLDSDEQLDELRARMGQGQTLDQTNANCCYARSNKAWMTDPDGLRWEAFRTHGATEAFGADTSIAEEAPAPQRAEQKACCGV